MLCLKDYQQYIAYVLDLIMEKSNTPKLSFAPRQTCTNSIGSSKNLFEIVLIVVNSSKASKRKLMSLSGGCLLDPHVECGFKSKYFPIDSVLRFILVEDLILWRRGYTSHLVKDYIRSCTNHLNFDYDDSR